MAVQPFTSSPLAKDIPNNPAGCQISPHHAPAVHVVEAVTVSPNGDIDHYAWLVCDSRVCVEDATLHADAISPRSLPAVLRDATLADLEELSGLAVTGEVAAA